MELHITLDKPTKEEIMKAYYAIVNTKANNEDTFINDGGRRSFRSSNDKKGASHAYWSLSDQSEEYMKD